MKIFTNFFGKIKAPFEKLGKSPDYDWYFTLYCFAAGLILMLAINSLIFLRLSSSEDEETVQENVPTVKLNREDINKAIEDMRQRDLDASQLSNDVIIDPSI